MPFGLKNAGATFQRAMDIALAKEIHDFLVVYLDDLTPLSKSDQEHLKHLRQIFMTCRKYSISINPKKSLFSLEEGKLLGHIISKYGIRIDPKRIQAILQIPYPRNVKELQAFLGKINFLRRFIPNLAGLIRLLRNMLKKDAKVKWSLETKQDFESIKTALTQTPVLTSPQFDKDFIIFSFSSEHTIVVVLLQKDDQGNEKPIAFFSRALRDEPLKYQIMEKQADAVVKAIKDLRIYILYSHVIAYVPNSVVKDILTQEGLEGKRGKQTVNQEINWDELVYGMEARFPSSLGIPTMKLLQEIQAEPNDMQRRVNQTIHFQQTREQVYDRAQMLQEKLKKMFVKKAKAEDFWVGSKVLRWDSRREDKGKHAKFDFLWKGPYTISVVQGNNTYFLKSLDGSTTEEDPVNGRMLKHYHDPF
eukprot:PITA_10147